MSEKDNFEQTKGSQRSLLPSQFLFGSSSILCARRLSTVEVSFSFMLCPYGIPLPVEASTFLCSILCIQIAIINSSDIRTRLPVHRKSSSISDIPLPVSPKYSTWVFASRTLLQPGLGFGSRSLARFRTQTWFVMARPSWLGRDLTASRCTGGCRSVSG